MTTLCLHCNASLTRKDVADGWCDSCGKKLPHGTGRETRAEAPAKKAAPVDGEPFSVFKAILAVVVVMLLAFFATRAYMSDAGSLPSFVKIAGTALVVCAVAIPVMRFRMPRTR